jgi:predicted MFS family arabinose efflux permease
VRVTESGNRARLGPIAGWAIAASVYMLASFHRATLGVAGLEAESRFGISPAQLGTFVLLQCGVYVLMQVPAGILVDRFSPRRTLTIAAALMATAQILMATTTVYPVALLARTILGCGDALAFVSVLRFAALHIAPKRYPLIVSLTSIAGFLGNILATLPLTLVLHSAGWTATFLGAGALSIVSGVLVAGLVPGSDRERRTSRRTTEDVTAALTRVRATVRSVWAVPGTRLAFWTHSCTMSTAMVFGILWGLPYLVESQGMSKAAASSLLLLLVVGGVCFTLVVGAVIAAWPYIRIPLATSCAAMILASWLILLFAFTPGHVPLAVIVVHVIVLSTGGPASTICFTLVRQYNRPENIGTAVGVVNVGGWTATTVGAIAMGWALDLQGSSGPRQYQLAWLVVLIVPAFGLLQALRWWRRARAGAMAAMERGESVPVEVVARWFDIRSE